MALSIDLGRSVLSTLGSSLNLTQHATALIIPPAGISHPQEINKLEEMLQNGELWVDQSPELELMIRVMVGPGLVGPASMFFSQIGEIICHSKLWHDLGLNVLFKSCDQAVESDHSTTFQFSFALRKKTIHSRAPKPLRIPARMRSTHEALPPDGFPTAYLSKIDISLGYKLCDQRTQRGIAGPLITGSISRKFQRIPQSVDIDIEEHGDILVELTSVHVEYPCLSESMTLAEKNDRSAFAEELQEPEKKWYPTPPFFQGGCPLLPEGQTIELDKEFHTLFDIGFRSLIAENQGGNKRIETSKSEDSRSLSKISPTVFSLGYREDMNQWSQFIPSIANSIASILEHSKNPELQHKRSLLTLPYRPQLGSSDTSLVRKAVKQYLWRTAQKQLYNPRASRNMKSLESASTWEEEYSKPEHIALFTSSTAGEMNNAIVDDAQTYYSDSDCYIGTDIDDFEYLEDSQEQEEEEKAQQVSHLFLTEDHTNFSIDMLAGASDEDEFMDLDNTALDDMGDADQPGPYIPPTSTCQAYSSHPYQSPPGDSEILASDPFDEDMSLRGPGSPPTTTISIHLGEFDYEDIYAVPWDQLPYELLV